MLPPVKTHRFEIDGESYELTEYTRGGQRRIAQHYARAYNQPVVNADILRQTDGDALYVEAVLSECLTDAPERFWGAPVAMPSLNGRPRRQLLLDDMPVRLFEAIYVEVSNWLESFRATTAPRQPIPRPPDTLELVTAQATPVTLRGVAE